MKRSGIIIFSLLLLTQPVMAQNYAPDLPDGSVVQYTYNGPTAYYGGWGLLVGPYNGTLVSPTNASITLYCVDFYQRVRTGTITANAWSLANPANFPINQNWGSGTTFANVSLVSFQKAAFLASLFQQWEQFNLPQADAWKAIHGAIWAYTSGPGGYLYDPAVQGFMAYADQNYLGYGGYGNWRLLETLAVGTNQYMGSQHFLVQTESGSLNPLAEITEIGPGGPETVTPEPQTYVLLGSGLLFLVLVGRRRLKENGYS